MTKPKGVDAGRDQFRTSRGRGEKPTDETLVKTAVGRGRLIHRAGHGDEQARDTLKRHGHDPDLGGAAA